ncbi:MAG: RimK family protein [bacterium]|nr:RimK family protein [bacterium]
MKTIIVLEDEDRWIGGDWLDDNLETLVVSPSEYLSGASNVQRRSARVCNFCRSYSYQSLGYYVSLLAEARAQRPFPDVMTICEMAISRSSGLISQTLEDLIDKSLSGLSSDEFVLSVYFGDNLAARYERLSRALYAQFNAPFLRCRFKRRTKWRLRQVSAIAISDIPEQHREFVAEAARRHFSKSWPARPKQARLRYDLAVLHDPKEGDLAPSCDVALKRFIKVAAAEGIRAELITAADAGQLLEYDALFIRETTAVNHHTFRLARRADASGMVVIDDPTSILRCTNKVFLAELLFRNGVPTPTTTVIHRGNQEQIVEQMTYPCVLKRPDSAFSQGVAKAENRKQFEVLLYKFFEDSDLVLVQEYMKTDFDWRIGLLDGEALFACKYHMARGHWQIAKHDEQTKPTFGKFETLPIELAPRKCVKVAKQAAALIGNGLYGVDVKESEGNFFVIEVNDNPNLDAGVEDKVLRDELYRRIARSFVRRLESR